MLKKSSQLAVIFTVLGYFLGATAWAQPASCSAPGKDGTAYLQPSYYPGNATVAAGSTNIAIGAIRSGAGVNEPANSGPGGTTPLSPGDLVMVIQMQDAQYNNGNSAAYGDGTTGRGWTSLNNSGKFEFRRVVSFTGSNLVIDQGLSTTYTRADPSAGNGANENGNRRFQVIRVPQFSALTMPAGTTSPPAWNGETGGVWVVDVAGNLNMNGATVNASSLGFRGAGGWPNYVITGPTNYVNTVPFDTSIDAYCTSVGSLPNPTVVIGQTGNSGAAKGEGIAGSPRLVRRHATTNSGTYETPYAYQDLGAAQVGYANGGFLSRGAPGNAGGGGTQHNAGGGGGSNAGSGGIGGNSFAFYQATYSAGCVTLTTVFFGCGGDGARTMGGLGGGTLPASIDNLIMGGGGGAGENNNACDNAAVPQAAGGSGGGIIFIRAGTISGNGTLQSNGQNALPGGRDAAGGGGAGGTVVVLTSTSNPALAIQANGGQGGNTGYSGSGGVPGSFLYGNETQGPGGGGGGGAVVRSSNIAAAGFTSVAFGGGAAGQVFPVNGNTTVANTYGSGAGGGIAATVPFVPSSQAFASNCLPQLQVNKRTTTPVVAFPDSNTAQYVVSIANTGPGTAVGATLSDILPVPFQYAAATAPNNVIGLTYAGTAQGPASPITGTGNTTLLVGTPGSNLLTNSFLLPPSTTVTFTVTIVVNGGGATPTLNFPYQNSATVGYLDPFRTVTTAQITPGTAYAGTTTLALGSNYASASSTQEDVRVLGSVNLQITKTNSVNTLTAGGTTAYTITVANLGSFPTVSATLADPAVAGLSCTTVTCQSFGGAVCPGGPLSINTLRTTGLVLPLLPPTTGAPPASRLVFTVNCGVTATGQ